MNILRVTGLGIIAAIVSACLTVPVQGQNRVHAVMTVSAEIVSGSQITGNTVVDISNQLNRADDSGIESAGLSLGDFTIAVPGGVEFIAEFRESVTMENGSGSFDLAMNVVRSDSGDGKVTFSVSGNSHPGLIRPGHYEGTKTAVIEYD